MKGFLGIIVFLVAPAAGVFIVNTISPGAINWIEGAGFLSIPYLIGVFMTPQEYFVTVREEEEE
jgi:hypothetical protein